MYFPAHIKHTHTHTEHLSIPQNLPAHIKHTHTHTEHLSIPQNLPAHTHTDCLLCLSVCLSVCLTTWLFHGYSISLQGSLWTHTEDWLSHYQTIPQHMYHTVTGTFPYTPHTVSTNFTYHTVRGTFLYTPHTELTLSYHSVHQLHRSQNDGHFCVHTIYRGLTLSLPQYPPTSNVTQWGAVLSTHHTHRVNSFITTVSTNFTCHKMRGSFVYTPYTEG